MLVKDRPGGFWFDDTTSSLTLKFEGFVFFAGECSPADALFAFIRFILDNLN